MKRGVKIDAKKCVACKNCELACAIAHSKSKTLFSAIAEDPLPEYRVTVKMVKGHGTPVLCRQCKGAPCMKACKLGAIVRESAEHPVVIINEKCTGCGLCVPACPFGAMKMDRRGKFAVKCDLCAERIKAGLLPACVVACPTHALLYESGEDSHAMAKEKRAAEAVR